VKRLVFNTRFAKTRQCLCWKCERFSFTCGILCYGHLEKILFPNFDLFFKTRFANAHSDWLNMRTILVHLWNCFLCDFGKRTLSKLGFGFCKTRFANTRIRLSENWTKFSHLTWNVGFLRRVLQKRLLIGWPCERFSFTCENLCYVYLESVRFPTFGSIYFDVWIRTLQNAYSTWAK